MSGIAVGVAIILVRLEAMWFLVTNKRYPKNVKQQVNCNSCKLLIFLQVIDDFSFHNQFWLLAAYLCIWI
jgi:hypothetical protein